MGQHETCFYNFEVLYPLDLGHWKNLDTLLSVQTHQGQFSLNSVNSVTIYNNGRPSKYVFFFPNMGNI
jgi:hypothetical protein